MIADQNFTFFYPTASATAYGQRPRFFRAEHSATAEGENCAYGPTLLKIVENMTNQNDFLYSHFDIALLNITKIFLQIFKLLWKHYSS